MADEAVRASQDSKEIIAKIDTISEVVNGISNQVARLETMIVMQPKIDEQMHEVMNSRISTCEKEVQEIRSGIIWMNRLIIATAFTAIIGIIIELTKVLQ